MLFFEHKFPLSTYLWDDSYGMDFLLCKVLNIESSDPDKDLSHLDSIIEDSMTTREKVEAIYTWAQTTIRYTGSSYKDDYEVEAHNVFTNHTGDCFSYYAATKVMFDLLEIPNIDVVKVKNHDQDSSHYWSLVSVDGGENHYHFDATPRKGTGDNFCLVTDAFLDAYSEAHQKCHNRDTSLYPATPTEELS